MNNSPSTKSPLLKGENSELVKPADEATIGIRQEKVGSAGFAGSVANLLKSIMGAGMLALPAAFAAVGILPALALLLVAAILALAGLQLLVLASNRLVQEGHFPARQTNFSELARPTYPRLSFLFEGAVFLKCLLVCASYMTVVGDTLVPLSRVFFPNASSFWHSYWFWVTGCTLLIAPVTFLHRMDSLKYTSFLGLGGIAYLFALSVIMFVGYNESFARSLANLKPFVPFSFSSLSAFATFVFALNCHQNIFPIYNEIKNNNNRRMFQLEALCITASSVMYAIFAISFLGVFGSTVDSNVIKSLPEGVPYRLARLLYALLMLASFPLQAFPSRASFIKLLGICTQLDQTSSPQAHLIAHVAVTVGILTVAWMVAVTRVDLGYLIKFVGCTAGPVICYFLPATFWLKLEENEPMNKGKLVAWSLIFFGVLATIIPLVALIWPLFR